MVCMTWIIADSKNVFFHLEYLIVVDNFAKLARKSKLKKFFTRKKRFVLLCRGMVQNPSLSTCVIAKTTAPYLGMRCEKEEEEIRFRFSRNMMQQKKKKNTREKLARVT